MIGGAVVEEDEFEIAKGLVEDAGDGFREIFGGVVARDEDADGGAA